MIEQRFKIYNKETLDTYIEDTQDCYSDGDTKKYWFGENEDFCDLFKKLNELAEENEQLQKELEKFKKWEKHIRNVQREDLDRVFKMSIYEIAEAFEYYKERIKKLENELME